jgi:hypothetical protein
MRHALACRGLGCWCSLLSLFTRCVTWRAVGTVRAVVAFWTLGAFTTRFALLTWFTRLAWLM